MTAREELLAFAADLNEDELAVLALVAQGLARGRPVYGRLEVATDQRDFVAEAHAEARDLLVYTAAHLVRARRAQEAPVVERARAAVAALKAACGAAQRAEEREEIGRLIASLTGDTTTSLTERVMGAR
jgi:hypothetical protein